MSIETEYQEYIKEAQFTEQELATFEKALDVAKPFMLEIIRIGQEMQEKIKEEVPDFDSDWDETGLIYAPSCDVENIEYWQNK